MTAVIEPDVVTTPMTAHRQHPPCETFWVMPDGVTEVQCVRPADLVITTTCGDCGQVDVDLCCLDCYHDETAPLTFWCSRCKAHTPVASRVVSPL